MMKFVLLLLSCVLLIVQCKKLTAEDIQDFKALCLKESDMDGAIIKKIVSYDTFPKPSEKYLKFIECMYRKQGYLDKDGLISYETIEDFILDFYDTEIVKLAIEPCVVKQIGNNGAERAYEAAKCLIKNLESLEEKYGEGEENAIKDNLA